MTTNRHFGLGDHEPAAERDRVLDTVFQELGGGTANPRAVMDALYEGKGLAKALQVSPKLEQVLYQFAYQALHLGRKETAHQHFLALCLINARAAEYWLGFSLSHPAWPQKHQMISMALDKALHLDPDNAAIRIRRVEFYLSNHDSERARQELSDSLAVLGACKDRELIALVIRLNRAFNLLPATGLLAGKA